MQCANLHGMNASMSPRRRGPVQWASSPGHEVTVGVDDAAAIGRSHPGQLENNPPSQSRRSGRRLHGRTRWAAAVQSPSATDRPVRRHRGPAAVREETFGGPGACCEPCSQRRSRGSRLPTRAVLLAVGCSPRAACGLARGCIGPDRGELGASFAPCLSCPTGGRRPGLRAHLHGDVGARGRPVQGHHDPAGGASLLPSWPSRDPAVNARRVMTVMLLLYCARGAPAAKPTLHVSSGDVHRCPACRQVLPPLGFARWGCRPAMRPRPDALPCVTGGVLPSLDRGPVGPAGLAARRRSQIATSHAILLTRFS